MCLASSRQEKKEGACLSPRPPRADILGDGQGRTAAAALAVASHCLAEGASVGPMYKMGMVTIFNKRMRSLYLHKSLKYS